MKDKCQFLLVRLLGAVRWLLKTTGLLPWVKRIYYRPDDGQACVRNTGLRYYLRTLIEQANYASVTEVHDLPPIYNYWSGKYLAPLVREFGFNSIEDFFLNEIVRVLGAVPRQPARLLSIGCGNCDFEVELACRLRDRGYGEFIIECMDINATMLARGAALAAQRGVAEYLVAAQADFNLWAPPEAGCYQVIIANQSLHHVVNLEGLFDGIHRALASDGRFVLSDMIGRNGHMRWPEALEIIDTFWQQLPMSYRVNRRLNITQQSYTNFDNSRLSFEGVRAQDILPLLLERFHFLRFIPFANVIDVFIDRDIGPNFDPARQWDTDFIDRVARADQAALETGRVKPAHLMASLSVAFVEPPQYPGNLSPGFCVRHPEYEPNG
ncbi:MAG: class I SAM-dependent methyltransferase [Nitrosomonadales bacterium]|nr:class I SAM-dependent methyltransferase [Nitrosomonadales bacterium]